MTTNPTGNAARQARYRAARRDGDGPDEQRLDLHISLPAGMALRRLAKHHGQSQKTALEQILLGLTRFRGHRVKRLLGPRWCTAFRTVAG